jgi:PKD repeat protein
VAPTSRDGSGTATNAGMVGTPPTANPGGPYAAGSKTNIVFDGSLSASADGSALTYDWDFGDATAHGSGVAPTHAYLANGVYTVSLVVTDGAGLQSVAATTTATINRPPIAVFYNAPYFGAEARSTKFSNSGSKDPDGGSITYDWDFGDGTPHSLTSSPSHRYADDGVYTVTLVVTDAMGAKSAPISTTATIANLPPQLSVSGPTTSFPSDYPFSVAGTFSDSGKLDTHVASIDWGDGTSLSPSRLIEATGAGTTGDTHQYAAPGNYTVSVTVTDNDGGATTGTLPLTVTAPEARQVLVGAGDVAKCTSTGDSQTSILLDQVAGWVMVLGDNAYPNGTTQDFQNCYDTPDSWGRSKARTHPVAGNHDYYTAGALPYYDYFGAQAGPRSLGYYSYDLGAWHIVVVNSSIDVAVGSVQEKWLRADLAATTQSCSLVMLHHPLYSSGPTGGATKMRPIFQAAYDLNVDLIITAHEHVYERFKPQDANGNVDLVRGIREFVIGTGGEGNSSSPITPLPNSDARYGGTTFGVIKFTLDPGSYSWNYMPVKGSFTDSGTENCHGAVSTDPPPPPPPPPTEPPPPPVQPYPDPPGPGDVTFVGAGDIASCTEDGDEATARVLDGIAGTVFALGDNAYESGLASEFAQCYDPTWGRHKARTRPAIGNHEYFGSPDASGYFDYFGAAAGEPGKGYYSYDLGAWHIVVLNSNIGRAAGTTQEQWLRADLASHPQKCTLAYFHHPRFSSGIEHGNDPTQDGLWRALYAGGVEVVLNGHEHNYERFAPQTPDAIADPNNGIREFVVGTGGRTGYGTGAPMANSEVRASGIFGVLKMTLRAESYSWEFMSASGSSFTDWGTTSCH